MKTIKDNTLFRFIRDFLMDYLPNQRFCSANTVQAYRMSLNLLFQFIKEKNDVPLHQITFDIITRQMLIDFLDWLEFKRACSLNTRNHRLACIRSFYKYAGGLDLTVAGHYHELSKVPLKKVPKSASVEFMSEKALTSVLIQPNTNSKKGFRDLFYMVLMYDTGARNREILNMKVRDVHTDEKSPYIVVTGKGNKTRLIPIMSKTVAYYRKYISLFHDEGSENQSLFYVIRDDHKQKMSDDNVARFMKAYGLRAKEECPEVPERVHPHMFRHTRAMHLYRGGMPLVLLSEWLGHAHLETTMIYANADTEMKRAAIEKATKSQNPLNSNKEIEFWRDDDELIKKLYGLK